MADHRPRLLCLHGGGTNATIFQYQSRNLISKLSACFHLVYAEAPFLCDAGPNVLPLYKDHGPFRCWLPWKASTDDDNGAPPDKSAVISAIEQSLERAMQADDAGGRDGPWVGLVGFSQGAKLSASLLLEQELRRDQGGQQPHSSSSSCHQGWKFAVLLHGIAPLVALSDEGQGQEGMQRADQILGLFSQGFQFNEDGVSRRVTVPTVHVHGLRDMGLPLSRKLLDLYCESATATLVEWDGDHRVPTKTIDVQKIVNEVFRISELA